MVVKIKQAAASVRSPLDYNYRKVNDGDAEVIGMSNIPEMTEKSVRKVFRKYENLSIRTQRLAFHMSINPAESEWLSDSKINEFAARLMEGLGYKKQPYVVFRHNDIDRTHYHVVSIRTGLNGRKIRDRQEHRRCQEVMREHAERYGYKIGSEGNDVAERLPQILTRFIPGGRNVVSQIEAIFRDCCSYHFTTLDQFTLIMRRHGLDVAMSDGDDPRLQVRGLDYNGKPCTPYIDERDTSYDMYLSCEKRAADTARLWNSIKPERSAVEDIADYHLKHSSGEQDFKLKMAGNGIEAQIQRDEKGSVVDVTFVDHKTCCAFSDGDMLGFGALAVQQTEESGQWKESEFQQDNNNKEESQTKIGDLLDALLTSRNGKSRGREPRQKKRKRRIGRR